MKAAIHGLGFSATTEEAGAINAVDGNGFTPLHRVLYLSPLLIAVHEVLFGSSRTKPVPEAVWSLVQWGADVNARDPSGFTPLHFTFVYNPSPFLDVVRLLLSSGADVNATTNLSGYAPLHFACALEDAKLVQMLLRAGADVNKASTDASGNTPLHFAMHADVSVVLIDMGANLHAKNVSFLFIYIRLLT